jgi:hypothetical protein
METNRIRKLSGWPSCLPTTQKPSSKPHWVIPKYKSGLNPIAIPQWLYCIAYQGGLKVPLPHKHIPEASPLPFVTHPAPSWTCEMTARLHLVLYAFRVERITPRSGMPCHLRSALTCSPLVQGTDRWLLCSAQVGGDGLELHSGFREAGGAEDRICEIECDTKDKYRCASIEPVAKKGCVSERSNCRQSPLLSFGRPTLDDLPGILSAFLPAEASPSIWFDGVEA